jgi:hypothetical protein
MRWRPVGTGADPLLTASAASDGAHGHQRAFVHLVVEGPEGSAPRPKAAAPAPARRGQGSGGAEAVI